jgi:hypothetical protein
VLPQGVQNLLYMLQVFGPSLAVNENFLKTHHYKRIREWSQYIFHHPHESGWSICQAKGHDQPFKKAFI